MERLVQYLDDLEDLYFAIKMLAGRTCRRLRTAAFLCASFIAQVGAILIALAQPPIALAMVSLAVVGMMYHGATGTFSRPH